MKKINYIFVCCMLPLQIVAQDAVAPEAAVAQTETASDIKAAPEAPAGPVTPELTPEKKDAAPQTPAAQATAEPAPEKKDTVAPKKDALEELPKPPAPITAEELEQKDPNVIIGYATYSVPDILQLIQPMLVAGGVGQIAESLSGLPVEKVVQLIEALLYEKKGKERFLKPEERVRLFVLLAYPFKDDAVALDKLFSAMLKYRLVTKDMPSPLVVAVQEEKADFVPFMVKWVQQQQEKKLTDAQKDLLGKVLYDAVYRAALSDEPAVIEELKKQGVTLTKEEASRVLWDVVVYNKTADRVQALVQLYDADINYIDPTTKHSVLMRAVRNGNLSMVKELVARGANVNLMSPDLSVGTALQIAITERQAAIDSFLRQKGAREDAAAAAQGTSVNVQGVPVESQETIEPVLEF